MHACLSVHMASTAAMMLYTRPENSQRALYPESSETWSICGQDANGNFYSLVFWSSNLVLGISEKLASDEKIISA
jgi:hypothetical protein